MTRHEAREQAFILLFEQSFQPDLPMEELLNTAVDLKVFVPDEFAQALATTAYTQAPNIDQHISANLVNWNFSRISRVALAVLRIALCEILYFADIPESVSINEAVEIAKKYAGEEDASFINGVLGSVVRAGAEHA